MDASIQGNKIVTSRPLFPPDGDCIAVRLNAISWESEGRKSYFHFSEKPQEETLEEFRSIVKDWGIE